MRRRLFFQISSIALLAVFLATCARPARAPGDPLPPVTANGVKLLSGSEPFEVRGVNYIRPTGGNATRCWTLQFGADANCPWNMAPINADLDRLQALGVNTVRVFLNYYVFGGSAETGTDTARTIALQHLDDFIAAANRRDMYVVPVLLIEYPQDRFAPEYYQRALDLHVRPVVRHLANRPGIMAWDLFNEPDIGSPIDIRCWDWDNADYPLCFPMAEERQRFVKMVHDEVKLLDPHRLTTVGMAFAKSYFEPHEAAIRMADVVDIYSFHYYDNEPYHSGRYAAHWYYGKGFPEDLRRSIAELHALKLNKPVIVSEIGFPTDTDSTRTSSDLQRDLRAALATIRTEQSAGILLWPFQTTPDDLVGDLFIRN